MRSAVQSDAITEAWHDYEKLIWSIIKKHWRGDESDAMGIASIAFMKAFDAYDDSKGAFSTWLTIKVRGALLDEAAKARQNARAFSEMLRRNQPIEGYIHNFSVGTILASVSQEAATLVSLILSGGGEIAECLASKKQSKALQEGLKTALAFRTNFSPEVITKAFREIEGALA